VSNTSYYKIGIAQDVGLRLSTLQIGCPYLLEVITLSPLSVEAPYLEITLHTQFQEKNIRGEWFELSPEDIEYIRLRFDSLGSE
jgi:hypothetical protein